MAASWLAVSVVVYDPATGGLAVASASVQVAAGRRCPWHGLEDGGPDLRRPPAELLGVDRPAGGRGRAPGQSEACRGAHDSE